VLSSAKLQQAIAESGGYRMPGYRHAVSARFPGEIMKLFNRLLCGVLIVVMLLSLCACGNKQIEAANESETEPATETEAATETEEAAVEVSHEGQTEYNGNWYELRKDLRCVLLIGVDETGAQVDSNSYNNDEQADFVVLLVIDKTNKTYKLIHINRDTMMDIPVLGLGGVYAGKAYGQLALAHTYGSGLKDSCRNTAEAVSDFFGGVEIDDYVSLSMAGISILNDAVGGVTVTIEDDFSEVDETMVMGETITLVGDQAEYFVRYRKGVGDQTNISRMARQRQFINEWTKLAFDKAKNNDKYVLSTLMSISDYMVSNMSLDQLSKLANTLSEYENLGIETIDGEAKLGEEFIEFYADEDSVTDIIIENFMTRVE
jgi:LCP family protein required for cell wall assembly